MQLVRSVCADAGENVATVGAVVAQVSAQSEGRSPPGKSTWRRQWNLLPVAYGLPVEGVAAAVRFIQHGTSVLSGMEPTPGVSSLLETMPANV
jgi:hypothetical protein